ncbi:MAG TPA: nucleoside deaminase [Bellilinea sp.]|nr:nucleoside deaminase [Bellilinea sp.]
MKWSELERPWQVCFEEAWEGFCAGSLPIGAAVFDRDCQLLARGRNHIYDGITAPGQISQNQLAHAELNTLLQVDRRSVDVHSCVLYTSMEPCPLCMGAIYMSGIRIIHFAARDAYAGSTDLLGTTPYLSRKPIQVISPVDPMLETIFLGMQLVAERRRLTMIRVDLYETVVGAWREKCPVGVRFGEYLASEGWLTRWVNAQRNPEWVYKALAEKLTLVSNTI